jgi:hypothetical protein
MKYEKGKGGIVYGPLKLTAEKKGIVKFEVVAPLEKLKKFLKK